MSESDLTEPRDSVRAHLLRRPMASNAAVAEATGADLATVISVRGELEAAEKIYRWRTRPAPHVTALPGHTSPEPVDGGLEAAVAETVSALPLGPADAALVRLATMIARTIDSMDDDLRARMLAQTAPGMLAALKALHERRAPAAAPARVSHLDELRARAAARRRGLADAG